MLNRVKDLYYEYCTPKPERFFILWDADISMPPANDTQEAQAERDSIDIHIHLVV